MNIFDDIRADRLRTEFDNILIDKTMLYCYDCKQIKYIKPKKEVSE